MKKTMWERAKKVVRLSSAGLEQKAVAATDAVFDKAANHLDQNRS